jgi:capsular exopolysaccharide synthesis family protein
MSSTLYTPEEVLAEQTFLHDAFVKLRRRKWSILLTGSVLAVILAGAIQVLPKKYHGLATVEADSPTPQAVPTSAMLRDQQFSDYTLGSELTILKSPELLLSVIHKLDLVNDPEFNPQPKHSWIGDAKDTIDGWLQSWLPNDSESALSNTERQQGETLAALRSKATFEPVPHSRDIQITVSSRDNRKAAAIANAIADAYIANHMGFAEQIMQQVHGYTGAHLIELGKDASQKAQIVAKFKNDHSIVTGREAPLIQEQITQVSTDLINARAQLAALHGRFDTARSSDPETLAAVLGSQTINRLREQQAQIGAQRAAMASNYVANNPTLGRLNAQYADIEQKIRQEAQRMVASLKSDIQSQEASVQSLSARLAELHKQIGTTNDAMAMLIPLQRAADAAADMYDTYARTLRQTDASMLIPATTVRVAARSEVPIYAAFPNNLIMLPASTLIAFGIAGMIGWMRETNRKGLVSMNQVEVVLDLPTLGMLPQFDNRNQVIYLDAVEQLFNRLWLMDRPRSILITSARPEEGKTTTAWALAKAAAGRDIRVLLIDADMRSGRKMQAARSVTVAGLADVLRGQADMRDVVQRNPHSANLTLLPAGHPKGIPTRLLALDSFNELLETSTQDYDLVIIDSPPSFVGGDCWLLSQKVDKTVLIAKWRSTTAQEIHEAVRKQLHRDTFAGVVLNMVNPRQNVVYGHPDSAYLSPEITRYYRS